MTKIYQITWQRISESDTEIDTVWATTKKGVKEAARTRSAELDRMLDEGDITDWDRTFYGTAEVRVYYPTKGSVAQMMCNALNAWKWVDRIEDLPSIKL